MQQFMKVDGKPTTLHRQTYVTIQLYHRVLRALNKPNMCLIE